MKMPMPGRCGFNISALARGPRAIMTPRAYCPSPRRHKSATPTSPQRPQVRDAPKSAMPKAVMTPSASAPASCRTPPPSCPGGAQPDGPASEPPAKLDGPLRAADHEPLIMLENPLYLIAQWAKQIGQYGPLRGFQLDLHRHSRHKFELEVAHALQLLWQQDNFYRIV